MFSGLVVNSSRYYLDAFVRESARSISTDALVLDAGAGSCPYRKYFQNARYESADFGQVDKPYGDITFRCDLGSIPVEDNRYDMVFLTQVLEHLPEPGRVLREMYRVLKPGSALWLSAPLYYEEHETPYDFYRYTQFGFRYQLEQAGFKVERIDWLEGYLGTLSYQCLIAGRALPLEAAAYGGGVVGALAVILALPTKPLFRLMSVIFGLIDKRHRFVSAKGHCKNYAIVAIKPAG